MSVLCPLLLALALVAIPSAHSTCPVPADLRDSNGGVTCAKLYEESNVYYENCCRGAELSINPNSDLPYLPTGWANKASSLVVAQRCELTVWSLPGKGGRKQKFTAGSYPLLEEYHRGLFFNWANAISRLYCKCS